MNFIGRITEKEYVELCERIERISGELAGFPAENIHIVRQDTRTKWYIDDGDERAYLKKSEIDKAKVLAHKKYLQYELTGLISEKKAMKRYLSAHSEEKCSKAATLLKIDSGYRELLPQYCKEVDADDYDWMHEPYEKCLKYPEKLTRESLSGNMTRSKSEAMIDSGLFLKGIAYRYECKMSGLPYDYYPDFTIRHPYTKEIWYWEHFGIMDSASYRDTTRNKIIAHAELGNYPGRNLICTYETLDDPFTPRKVEDTIKYYFGV